ncbi:kinase-like domain-containing protein [Rhizophagus diaphanus]|nr:kinase-like domain-containing protein [Rhizophagus diaphanus] [Rhizophagus sp. MUCL 43196]
MDEIKLSKLSDDVFEQIKDFKYRFLTEEQESLIDKLILNKELKERYKENGLCEKCNSIRRNRIFCNYCLLQIFKSVTSGNHDVDEFIQRAQLKAEQWYQIIEWIEYDKFENIEYLAKGGFGTTYKAVWKDGYIHWDGNIWERIGIEVALKCLHNSQDITADFLKEVESTLLVRRSIFVVRCLGITKDPKTNNFIMVMELKKGSLRQHLSNNFISLNWKQKLHSLYGLADGLNDIHNKELIHHDLHCGNILSNFDDDVYITDLGLCQPANVKTSQDSDKKIYGALPYIAPEVLRGKEYTQASDIYAYGINAYEICTGFPPYYGIAHDELLAIKICQGLRPSSNYKIPQVILDMIIQCWDANPLKRPKAEELYDSLFNLYYIVYDDEDSAIHKQALEANEINKKSSLTVQLTLSSTGTLSYTTHPQAVYTSRLLDFKNLPEPKNADNNETEDLESLRIGFTKLDINSKDENI